MTLYLCVETNSLLLQLNIRHDHIMVGIAFDDPVELPDTEMAVGENIIDTQRGRKTGKSAPDTKPLFQEGILHVTPDGEIGIGIGDIVQVRAKQDRMRAIRQYFFDHVGLDAAERKTSFYFGEDIPGIGKQAVFDACDLPDPFIILFAELKRL